MVRPIPVILIRKMNRTRTIRTRMTSGHEPHPDRNDIMPGIDPSTQIAVSRTFVIAHLPTASIDQAESACREALDAWNPETDDETLFGQDPEQVQRA
jgi:hypothetical protein